MLPVATAAESAAIDRYLIDTVGFPSEILMEAAGTAVAKEVCARWPQARRIVVVCGPGNNGGDGFVCGRVLASMGAPVTVIASAPLARYRGVAGKFAKLAQFLDARLIVDDSAHAPSEVSRQLLAEADVVVDALFGTGARALSGRWAVWVQAINQSPGKRIAIDIPSGLCATTAQPLGVAVKAEVTVAMITHKLGAMTVPGCAFAGEVVLADLAIPAGLLTGRTAVRALTLPWALSALPPADASDHKGVRGHVAVVGGAAPMRGAARLAARGALRSGAGVCTWLPPPFERAVDHLRDVNAPDPIMVAASPTMADFEANLDAALARRGAVVLGPGIGRDSQAHTVVGYVLTRCSERSYPLVADADALFHFASWSSAVPDGCVITPHPAEAARLLGVSVDEVQRDRVAAARTLAARYRAVVVLKGQRTLICDGMRLAICLTGSEALATAGTGDVLAGVVASFLAQGISSWEAAAMAAVVHGAGGERLASLWGQRGAMASDLPDAIALAMRITPVDTLPQL